MNLKRSGPRKNVPWFSMAEWDQVYKDIYSDISESQVRGYQQLLVWKARIPNLPASIECTLELIQVCLRDRDISSEISDGKLPVYAEYDLRLMYSTSIMRFLNHLSSIAQNADETLFTIAKKLHIPEWLVCLRHDTAHGSNLPSLDILRAATHVALDWLHVHYWKSEAEMLSDWIPKETSREDETENDHELKELIDIWQALKLHTLIGYTLVSEIPDLELREYVKKIQPTGFPEGQQEGSMKLNSAVNMMLEKVLNTVRRKMKQKRKSDMNNEVVERILETESFIPCENSMKQVNESLKLNLQNDCLPSWLFLLWRDFISSLHKSYTIVPHLVHKLINLTSNEAESAHHRRMAAFWVKELCRGVSKGSQVLKEMNQWKRRKRNILHHKLYKKHLSKVVSSKVLKLEGGSSQKMSVKKVWKLMTREVEKKYPNLKSVLSIEIKEVSGSICSPDMLRETVLKPNKFTYLFLPSFLDLVVPPIPDTTKKHLLSLVRIYTARKTISDKGNEEEPIHTIQELEEQGKKSEEMDVDDTTQLSANDDTESSPIVTLGWTKCADHQLWSKCPIGLLPWQMNKVPTLHMPKDIRWMPLQSSEVNNTENSVLPGFFQEKINWNDVVRKQPKKSKSTKKLYKHSRKLIMRAFDAVLSLE